MYGLEAGQEFGVELEERGKDGILYLKLADGRGWVFDQKPSLGAICAKGQAQLGKTQKPLRTASPRATSTPKQASSRGRNQSRKASPKPSAKTDLDKSDKAPLSERRGRSPRAKEKASPIPRSLAVSLDKAASTERRGHVCKEATTKPLAGAVANVEADKASSAERRGHVRKEAPRDSPKPAPAVDEAQAPSSARRGRTQAPTKPLAGAVANVEADKASSAERRGHVRKEAPRDSPKAVPAQACTSRRRARNQAPSDAVGPTAAEAEPDKADPKPDLATHKGKAVPKLPAKDPDKASPKPSVPMKTKGQDKASSPKRSRSPKGAATSTKNLAKEKAPEFRGKPTPAPHKLQAKPLEVGKLGPALRELQAARERSRTCPPVPRFESRPRRGDAKVPSPCRTGLLERLRRGSQAPAPISLPTSPRRAAVQEVPEPSSEVSEAAPEPSGSEASEASDLSAELQAQEEASRQFHQMESCAKNAWQQAKAMAEALAQQKEEEDAQADARRRLAKAQASRQAAEARVAEVETSLESLRTEIKQVEEESHQRIASLRSEAEAASCQKDTCLAEALATAQGAKEDAQRHLQSLEQRCSAELRLAKEKYADEQEVLLQNLADHQLKAQGPVLELEARAEAQRQAAGAEARAQEAAAPQLAALKSEVVEAERRAAASEEAWRRAEDRALAEEARLAQLLARMPQAEADAARESQELVAEANRAAIAMVSEATEASEREAERSKERLQESQELLESERVRTQHAIEQQLSAASSAQQQAEEAAAAAEQAAIEAEEQTARALKESSDAYAAAKGEARSRTAAAQCQQRDTEKQVAENIANLRAEHSRKVLAATRASEEAAQAAKRQVEALQAKFKAHHHEMSAKVQDAECKMHRAGSDLEETKKWSEEVRTKMCQLVEDSQQQLAEQEKVSHKQLEAEEAAAEERLEAARALRHETEALAEAADQDGRARRAAAKAEAERAAGSAERRRAEAEAALAERELEAAAEIEAVEAEAEENFEALGLKVSQAWSTCKEQSVQARQQLSEAEKAANKEVARMNSRLEEVRELAKAAAAQAKEAAERKAEASRQLQSEEFRVQAARSELSSAERSLDCSVAQCEELLASAELAAQEHAEAFAALCNDRAREEEEQAEAAEQLAFAEETRALAAEEATVFEDLTFQGQLESERKRIQDEIDRAMKRTIEVESAIQEAVSYSEKSTRELLKYMEKVVQHAGEPIESSQASQATDPLDGSQCSQCHVEASPGAAYCKNCGHHLQQPAISDSGSPSVRRTKPSGHFLKGSKCTEGPELPTQQNAAVRKLQKRLAASILGCGKNRVWLDPNETNELSMANSRFNIRKMIKDGLIIRKAVKMHSRSRVRKNLEAKRKGRHTGIGKRKGTREARMPTKVLWMRRQRVLRRLLRKYRQQKKIDKRIYHYFYRHAKGNCYKNKRVLMEAIHAKKTEKMKEKALQEQSEARKEKARLAKEKKLLKKADAARTDEDAGWKLQKRLAASILGCGKNRVWLDPNETNELSMANSRFNIRKMIKDGLIIRKAVKMHSRSRVRKNLEAKRKGRHTGIGKRKGTREARMPTKVLWMRRQRVLRRLLRKYRQQKKIDKRIYHYFYRHAKGNCYKNKRVLMEAIHAKKTEKMKEKALQEQSEARKEKARLAKEKKLLKKADAARTEEDAGWQQAKQAKKR
ncbi:RPL19B [Symbiodinium natans]|uniref:Ribosomal protein L19 n=1 Tax=Symbiodinium natans TaxID=878477 RepID=A0A812JNN7_9DINO|nr:RPL19B [Symbiodinium natans]